ncbi:HWE histidine kinase domain-containing protein [Sphingomonas floccifaciens]|uniref:histidine kinase n=1 Tax=Sphingomonas floccifaciens TaxID=1844115 RepID=A0ABW4NCM0_9SPHN
MTDVSAEDAAIVLARQALSLLKRADAEDSVLVEHLSRGLKAVASRQQCASGPGGPIDEGSEHCPDGAAATTGCGHFTTIDGRQLRLEPEALHRITAENGQTVLLLSDGTVERLRDSFESVAARLGHVELDPQAAALGGLIAVGAARHQLRNLLAIVSALIGQALDHDGPTVETGREIAARISMLTRISDLLLQPDGRFDDLATLIRMSLAEGGTGRVLIAGPDLPISAANAAALALALHELEVHALRFGSLSDRNGHVEVRWEVSSLDEPYLWLQWAERNGPYRQSTLSSGFGRRLLLTAAPRRLRGAADLQELPSGLVWSLHAPVAALCA